MAKYPDEIYTPREKENRSGVSYDPTKKTVIFSEDVKKLDDEVVAIEETLGPNLGNVMKEGWELFKSGTFTDTTAIEGLDGNSDKLYKLVLQMRHTFDFFVGLGVNDDEENNYDNMMHGVWRWFGSDYHDYWSEPGVWLISILISYLHQQFAEILIQAEAGGARCFIINAVGYTDGNNYDREDNIGYWRNTSDNLTKLNLILLDTTPPIDGKYWLFRKKG